MKSIISILSLIVIFCSCGESEYTKLVKNEFESGKRYDSLLFNIKFEDQQKDFFAKCWQLNSQGLVTHGPNNSSVQYVFKDSLSHDTPTTVVLLFYPKFDEKNQLNNLDMEISYSAWSPWNRAYQSDSLLVKVVDMMERWYGGNPFIYVDIEKNNHEIPIKVDGNRRIILRKKDDQTVLAVIQDIYHQAYKHPSL